MVGPEHTKPMTHLVHVEDEVQLADVLKALVQRLHEHLRKWEGKVRAEITAKCFPHAAPVKKSQP